MPTWLVADVGGTNVRFALADAALARPLQMDSVRLRRVVEFASLEEAASRYAHEMAVPLAGAVFAVAGHVVDGEVQLTNHAWSVSAVRLSVALGGVPVELVNDFAAASMAVTLLDDESAVGLPTAHPRTARQRQACTIVGPGTGLGVAALRVQGDQATVIETEGGHVAFAPGDDEQIGVLRLLRERFGQHVSTERLLSGPGLSNLHQALCMLHGASASMSTPEQLIENARAQRDDMSRRAVQMFCQVLASALGDFVLAHGSWDGAYLVGSLSQSLRPWLGEDTFRRQFESKGRFRDNLSRVPLWLVTHPQPGLLGGAGYALRAHRLLRTA